MSGNPDELPEDPFAGGRPETFEQSQARDRRREAIRRRAREQFPFLDEDDVSVEQGEDGLRARFSEDAQAEIQRRAAAVELDETLSGVDVGPSDVQSTEDGFVVTADVQREVAAEELDAAIEALDVGPADIEETEEGFKLGGEAEKQLAAQQLDEELGAVDVGPSDVVETDEGFTLTEEAQPVSDLSIVDADDTFVTFALRENLDEDLQDVERKFELRESILDALEDVTIKEFRGSFIPPAEDRVDLLIKQAEDDEDLDADALREREDELETLAEENRLADELGQPVPTIQLIFNEEGREQLGTTLSDEERRQAVREQIIEEDDLIDEGDIEAVELVGEEDAEVRLTGEAQRRLAREQIIQEDDLIGEGDIQAVEPLTAEEQVEALQQRAESDDEFSLERDREELVALAEEDQLAESFEDVDVPRFDVEFAPEARERVIERRLVEEDDRIGEGDVLDVDVLSPEERVELAIARTEGLEDTEETREQLLQVARDEDSQIGLNDIAPTEVPEFIPQFSDEAERRLVRESLAESDELIDQEDITALEQRSPSERVDILLQRADASDRLDAAALRDRRDELEALAEDEQLDREFPGVDVPEFQPQLATETRKQLFERRLVEEEDSIDAEDVQGVRELEPAERVERAIQRVDAFEDTEATRQQLLQIARGESEFTLDDVAPEPIPQFAPDLSQEAERELFRERVVESDEDIFPADIEQIRELSPEEQVDRLISEVDQFEDTEDTREELLPIARGESDFSLSEVVPTGTSVPEFEAEFTTTFEREQVAAQLDERLEDREIVPRDVVPTEEGTFELREEIRREIAAEDLDEQLDDRDIGPGDLVQTEEGFRLGRRGADGIARLEPTGVPEGVQEIAISRRLGSAVDPANVDVEGGDVSLDQEARQILGAVRQVDAQTDVDVTQEDITGIEDGEVQFDADVERQLVAERVDEQFETDVSASAVEERTAVDISEGGLAETGEDLRDTTEFRLETETRRALAAEQLDRVLDEEVTAEDVTQVGQRFTLSRERTAERFDEQVQGVDIGEDDLVQRAGGFQLGLSQRELAARRLDRQFETPTAVEEGLAEFGQEPLDIDITAADIERTSGPVETARQRMGAIGPESRLELDSETQRLIAAERLDRQAPVSIDPSDLEQTPSGRFAVGDDVREDLERVQRQRVARQLSGELDRDLDAGDVTFESGRVRLARDVREEIAFEAIQEETAADLSRDDVEFNERTDTEFIRAGVTPPSRLTVSLTDEAATREQEAIREAQDVDVEFPDDVGAPGIESREQIGVPEGTSASTSRGVDGGEQADDVAIRLAAGAEETIADLPGVGAAQDVITGVGSTTADALGGARDAAQPVTSPIVSASEDVRDATVNRFVDPVAGVNLTAPAEAAGIGVPGELEAIDRGISGFLRGAGTEAANLTVGAPALASDVVSAGSTAGEAVAEEVTGRGLVRGTASLTESGVELGSRAAAGAVEAFKEAPAATTGRFAGAALANVAIGTAAVRGAEVGTQAARARVAARGGPTVSLNRLTPSRQLLTDDGVALFETSPRARASEAVSEFRERAADVPSAIGDEIDASRLSFRSESARLNQLLDVDRGEFELPGLFTAPDVSLLRTGEGASLFGSGVAIRRPRLFAEPERFSAFETPDVRAIPDKAAEAGFAVRASGGEIVDRFPATGKGAARARALAEDIGGQRVPDPAVAGAQFLDDQAERGVAFVRATGDRTSEAEAIFPPGSQFERVSTALVKRDDGTPATLDIFRRRGRRRADSDADVDADTDIARGAAQQVDDTFSADEVSELLSRSRPLPESAPLTPVPFRPATGGVRSQSANTGRTRAASRAGASVTTQPTATTLLQRDASSLGERTTATESSAPTGTRTAGTAGIDAVAPATRTDRETGASEPADVAVPTTGATETSVDTGDLIIPPTSQGRDSASGGRGALPPTGSSGLTDADRGLGDLRSGVATTSDGLSSAGPTTSAPRSGAGESAGVTSPTVSPSVSITSPSVSANLTPPGASIGAGADAPARPVTTPGGDDSSSGDLALRSEVSKQFSSSVATPEAVLEGDLENLEFSEATSEPIDTDATPEVVDISGDIDEVDL